MVPLLLMSLTIILMELLLDPNYSDYNAKKAQMQYLQKKALDRNPDEFYYHMINSEVKVCC